MKNFDVLVVDDEKVFCIIMRKRLEALNYNPKTVTSAKEAQEFLKTEHPDLIITDLMMPEMDGIELVKWIKTHKELRDIYIIMLTAKSDMESKKRTLNVGANEFVTKPINDDELSDKVINGIETTKDAREKN